MHASLFVVGPLHGNVHIFFILLFCLFFVCRGEGLTMMRLTVTQTACPNHVNWDLNPNFAGVSLPWSRLLDDNRDFSTFLTSYG